MNYFHMFYILFYGMFRLFYTIHFVYILYI